MILPNSPKNGSAVDKDGWCWIERYKESVTGENRWQFVLVLVLLALCCRSYHSSIAMNLCLAVPNPFVALQIVEYSGQVWCMTCQTAKWPLLNCCRNWGVLSIMASRNVTTTWCMIWSIEVGLICQVVGLNLLFDISTALLCCIYYTSLHLCTYHWIVCVSSNSCGSWRWQCSHVGHLLAVRCTHDGQDDLV